MSCLRQFKVKFPDPRVSRSHERIHSEMIRSSSASALILCYVTPQLLYNNYYNISSITSQAVYATNSNALNPNDLTNFQIFSLPVSYSISFASYEDYIAISLKDTFNTKAIKLESGNPEIACTSQISPSYIGFTTGGWFSNYYI